MPVLKEETKAAEGAKWGSMFTSIMAGGFTIIPLMMLMENKTNKKKIVRWLDEKTYGKETVEKDSRFEESYRQIDEEPKKGLWAGMIARFIAIAPLITAVSIPAINTKLIKYIYDPIGNTTKKAALKIGIKPSKDMLDPLKGRLEHIDGCPKSEKQWQSNWDFLHRTIGFDFGLTIVYAILHEITYKSLAAMGMKKNKESQKERPTNEPQTTAKTETTPAYTEQQADNSKPARISQTLRREHISHQDTLTSRRTASETELQPAR